MVQEGVSGAVPPDRVASTVPLPLPLQSIWVITVEMLMSGGSLIVKEESLVQPLLSVIVTS